MIFKFSKVLATAMKKPKVRRQAESALRFFALVKNDVIEKEEKVSYIDGQWFKATYDGEKILISRTGYESVF